MMMTMCLIFCCACANVSDDDPVVLDAGAVVGDGSTAIAAGAWVGGAVVGGMGDAAGAGPAAPVPMLQANAIRIETIHIALLNIFIAALSLLHS
jgi:hypothetical protein